MRTTEFGRRIIESAEEVLQFEYRAGSRNYFGEGLERLIQEYDLLQPSNKRYFKGKGNAAMGYACRQIHQ